MGETLADRRTAAEEIRGEILALLREILGAMKGPVEILHRHEAFQPPPLTPEESRQLEQAILAQQQQLSEMMVLEGEPKVSRGVWPDALARLLWLLGLSDGERAFVEAAAEHARGGQPGEATIDLAVYAEWLGDQLRHADAGVIGRLAPQTGDVLLVRHPDSLATKREAAAFSASLEDGLRRLGREPLVAQLPFDWDVETLDVRTGDLLVIKVPPDSGGLDECFTLKEKLRRAGKDVCVHACLNDREVVRPGVDEMHRLGWVRGEEAERLGRENGELLAVNEELRRQRDELQDRLREARLTSPPPSSDQLSENIRF